tara:strand:- start:469 stop:1383 length:915 start_codon:yes stop_codon:yes gene_type:complete
MKKIFVTILLLNLSIAQAQKIKSAGIWMNDDEFKGQPMIFGSNDAMDTVIKAIEAYNKGNAEEELSYYSEDYKNKNKNFTNNWHNQTKMLNMKPWVMFPVKIKGDDRTQVLSWSVEEREWENGSKQKQNLMEIFVVDDESGKINNFVQWRRNYPENEFGLAAGGKFFGESESDYTGRKLVFSNRGETEKIEKLIEAYNKKDFETCKTFFVDGSLLKGSDGSSVKFTYEMWESYFENYSEINWKPYSIVPLKIYDTDPASGVSVLGIEKRVFKDGSVWEKETVDYFYFNINGLIDRVVQFERKLK